MALTWKLEADLDGDGTFEVDWTAYLLRAEVKRGRTSELDPMGASTATFQLDNKDGRFSPDNGIVAVDHFVPITFYVTTPSVYKFFTGFISNMSYEPELQSQRTILEATDILGLADKVLINMGRVDGFTADLVLNRVLDLIERGEVVANSGCEVDTTGWALVGDAAISRDTATVFEGDASLKCITGGSATLEGCEYDITSLTANPYDGKVGLFINAPAAATLAVALWDTNGYGSGQEIVGTGSWQYVSGEASLGAPAATQRTLRIFTMTPVQAITFYVDGVHCCPYTNKIDRSLEVGQTALYRVSFADTPGLEALRKVVDCEPSVFWVDGFGVLQFKDKDYGAVNGLTATITAAADDPYLRKFSAVSYAAARAGAATPYFDSQRYLGQSYAAPSTYGMWRPYFRFDTSGIIAPIVTAKLRLYLTVDETDTDFTIQARQYDWSPTPLAAGDWRASPSGDTLMGSFDTTTLPAINNYFEIDLTPATIDSDGYTELYLHSDHNQDDDDDPASTAPTGHEFLQYEPYQASEGHPPELVVTYATPIWEDSESENVYQGLRLRYDAEDRYAKVRVNCKSVETTESETEVLWRWEKTLIVPAPVTDNGTTEFIGPTGLIDIDKAWTVNQWIGARVTVAEGGHNHYATVTSNLLTTLSFQQWWPHKPTALTLAYTINRDGLRTLYASFSASCASPLLSVTPAQAGCSAAFRSYTATSGIIDLLNTGAGTWTITDLHVDGNSITVSEGGQEAVYEYEPAGTQPWVQRVLELDMPFLQNTSQVVIDKAVSEGEKRINRVLKADVSVIADTNAYLEELLGFALRDRVHLTNDNLAYSLGIDEECWIEGIDWAIDRTGKNVQATFHLEEI
jgi:hypothetical protein